MAIDSLGTLLAVHVCAANKADGAEAGAVMVQACERHPSLESFTADSAYQRQAERAFAWLGQCRLRSKEDEKTVASAEVWLWCAMMRLLVRRLSA